MTIGAAKPTRPATSLLAVNVLHRVIYQANCASWACHRHRRHPVETDRPRKSSAALGCQSDTNSTSVFYIGLGGGTTLCWNGGLLRGGEDRPGTGRLALESGAG